MPTAQNTSSQFIIISMLVLATVGLAGCGSSDGSGASSTSLSYDFTSNNCPTGKHTFSDQASYCAGLKDDARNNYCAKDIREQVYAERCGTTAKASPSAPQSESSPQTVSPPHAPSTPETASPAPTTTLILQTDSVVINAVADEKLAVQPKVVGNIMMTTLNGSATIQSVLPDVGGRTLNLMDPTTVKFLNLELEFCYLRVKNFTNVATTPGRQQVKFTLIGSDPIESANRIGCLVKLSTMAMSGFSLEFTNVRLGGSLSTYVVPVVRLDVAPATVTQ